MTPFAYGRGAEMGPSHYLCIGQAFGGPKNHSGPQYLQMPGAATAHSLLQHLFFARGEFQFGKWSASRSHAPKVSGNPAQKQTIYKTNLRDTTLELFAVMQQQETLPTISKAAKNEFGRLWKKHGGDIQKFSASIRTRFHALIQGASTGGFLDAYAQDPIFVSRLLAELTDYHVMPDDKKSLTRKIAEVSNQCSSDDIDVSFNSDRNGSEREESLGLYDWKTIAKIIGCKNSPAQLKTEFHREKRRRQSIRQGGKRILRHGISLERGKRETTRFFRFSTSAFVTDAFSPRFGSPVSRIFLSSISCVQILQGLAL